MEDRDIALIQELLARHEELARLWAEHQELEGKLNELAKLIYRTPEEDLERKRLQKLKLAGRDRIEQILRDHRAGRA